MDNLEKGKTPKKDRVLGDEWKGWDGSSKEPQIINEKKGTFLTTLLIVILFLDSFLLLAFYLISPRLKQISGILDHSVLIVMSAFCLLTILWYISILMLLYTGRNFLLFNLFNRSILSFIIDKTSKLGTKMGISKDRMGNSFIKVFNEIIKNSSRSNGVTKPLIILPRCLTKEDRAQIAKLSEQYDLEYFVVGGGQAALEKIRQIRPRAIIGVACERDLLAGIKEVSSIPVLAIANKRPNGPCKDTNIDMEEMERSIKHFLRIT